MDIKILGKKYYKVVLLAVLPLLIFGCDRKKGEPDPKPDPGHESTFAERVTVIYACNRSSLAGAFVEDTVEIVRAIRNVDLTVNKLLLYKTDSDTQTGLYEIVKSGDSYKWEKLKNYERTTTSTEPKRMAEVLQDAAEAYQTDARTLFFWGHGSAWTPENSDHKIDSASKANLPVCYGYGGEYGVDRIWNWTDIDDLAEAIPDGVFDTIWFDCCYMASVEVAYELRDKTRWFVAYPTEVWDKGLNYDVVLPLTMPKQSDLITAATKFFDSYNIVGDPVTVTVMDMTKIEPVAKAVNALYKAYPQAVEDMTGVANYRRGRYKTPYSDMMQLLHKRVGGIDTPELKTVQDAMDKFIVMHHESPKDFNNIQWCDPDLSGLSLHNFVDSGTSENEYYKTLQWYEAVTK